jgi:hypothetical protein
VGGAAGGAVARGAGAAIGSAFAALAGPTEQIIP